MGRYRRRLLLGGAVALLVIGAPPSVDADEGPLPGSCKLHQKHVVNPGCAPALTSDLREPGITLPDLMPNVGLVQVERMATFDEATGTWWYQPPALLFDTYEENHGTVAFDILADDPNTDTSTASQCVSWTAAYVCRERVQMGGFIWHGAHSHFHLDNFAAYSIRRLGPDGRPDYSSAGLVAESPKVSFCLVDSTWWGEQPQPTVPTYPPICTRVRQGISAGWADLYDWTTPGQSLSLEGLTDGDYALIFVTDPDNIVLETNDANNVIEATVRLSEGVTKAEIVATHRP